MFKRNSNYKYRSYERSTEIQGKEVTLYPENKLEQLTVTSDFGDCLVITSDLFDLFNQQRISNLGADVVRDFIARNYPTSSAISDSISKMSDDDILASIKPRNIQNYSELMQWSKYLNEIIEQGLKTDVSEPAPVPVPEPAPELPSEPNPKSE